MIFLFAFIIFDIAVLFLAIVLLMQRCTSLEGALQTLYVKHTQLDGRVSEVFRRRYL